MKQSFGDYVLDTDLARVQFGIVHEWLASTYWSPDVPFEKVVNAAENSSLVVSAYKGDIQIGYLRVVSDRTSFAWVCDVFVAPKHRGKGIAKAMVNFALTHPDHQSMRRWLLATKDAHEIYATCGFEPIKAISRWMVRGANPAD